MVRASLVGTLAAVLLSAAAMQPWTARAAEPEGGAAVGRELFEVNCSMCHGSEAAGMMGMHPSLRGAVERLTREGVEVTIRKGRATQPPMPSFEDRLSDQEITHVIAYLDSLPVGPRNFGPEADGMMDGDGMMGGGMAVWLLVVVVLVVAAVATAVWFARRADRTRPSTSSARDELDRRYAAGDIDRDDYLQRRRDLES